MHLNLPQTRSAEFNARAGLLVFNGTSYAPLAFNPNNIATFHYRGKQLYIRGFDYYDMVNTNYPVAFHFYQRALANGESFDLRPICDLTKGDEFYKEYLKPDVSDEIKHALAARVKTIKPGEFI